MAGAWRIARVFISSTFKDMQAERDMLVRFVFAKLEKNPSQFTLYYWDSATTSGQILGG